MHYNFVADSFHTRKLCSRLSSSKVRFELENGRFAFFGPLWGLAATYHVHLRLNGKRVVDFLLVLIELFFARCYGWGSTSDYRFKIGDFAPKGVGWPKISHRRCCPTNHSSSPKTRLNDLSYGVKIWTDLSSVLSQCTRRSTDGQTDRQTDDDSLAFNAAR